MMLVEKDGIASIALYICIVFWECYIILNSLVGCPGVDHGEETKLKSIISRLRKSYIKDNLNKAWDLKMKYPLFRLLMSLTIVTL